MDTNVPKRFYVFAIVTSIIGIAVYVVIYEKCSELACDVISSVLSGIFTGALSGVLVALFFDVVNTRIQNEKEKEIYERLIGEFRSACDNLPYEFLVAVQEAFGIDDENRTFEQWASRILVIEDGASESIIAEADYALQQVTEIRNLGNKLLSDSTVYMGNTYINDAFIKSISKICSIANKIDIYRKKKKYSTCLSLIEKDLIPAICAWDSSLKETFDSPFNWSKIIDDEQL
jgi:hypothetical protein